MHRAGGSDTSYTEITARTRRVKESTRTPQGGSAGRRRVSSFALAQAGGYSGRAVQL